MLCRVVSLGAVLAWMPVATLLADGVREDAAAAEAETVAVGSRVRITSPELGAQPLVGQVLALEPGAVVVGRKDGSDTRRVSLTSATSLEVSMGRKSQAARGAMIGGAIGALSGILINVGDYNSDENALAVSIVGAASCAAVGALVGWGIKSDVWRPAKTSVSAAIVPVPRGAALSVRVAWGQRSR